MLRYPELQSTDYGEILLDYFMDIIDLYRSLATRFLEK